MIRALSIVALAIQITAPHLSKPTRLSYAKVLQAEGAERDIDPFTMIAMIDNETGRSWRAGLVGGIENKCHGLGQICVQYVYPVCRGGGYDGAECLARRGELLDGVTNIRVMAGLITANRRVCREITGHTPLLSRWLPSYQGYNSRTKGIWCGMVERRGKWVDAPVPALTRKVMARRKWLIRAVGR